MYPVPFELSGSDPSMVFHFTRDCGPYAGRKLKCKGNIKKTIFPYIQVSILGIVGHWKEGNGNAARTSKYLTTLTCHLFTFRQYVCELLQYNDDIEVRGQCAWRLWTHKTNCSGMHNHHWDGGCFMRERETSLICSCASSALHGRYYICGKITHQSKLF